MNNIYDYKNNIKAMTTVNGDKVLCFNKEIYTTLLNAVFDASEYHEAHGRHATASDLVDLWNALRNVEYKDD